MQQAGIWIIPYIEILYINTTVKFLAISQLLQIRSHIISHKNIQTIKISM